MTWGGLHYRCMSEKAGGKLMRGPDNAESADARLSVFLSFIQPALQDRLVSRFDRQEGHARAHIHLGVNDFRFGLEKGFARGNFHEYESSDGERIHHVQV